jgi:hypothetical protein
MIGQRTNDTPVLQVGGRADGPATPHPPCKKYIYTHTFHSPIKPVAEEGQEIAIIDKIRVKYRCCILLFYFSFSFKTSKPSGNYTYHKV